MTYRYLSNLADVVRLSGLKVIEIPGWQTRGRPPSTGGFDPEGVDDHHTGSYDEIADYSNDLQYAEWLAKVGRSDLPAPLCQIALSAESVAYVCAAGRANHAGDMRASGPIPAGDGNARLVGIEAMNSGTQGWGSRGVDAKGRPITQYEGYVRLNGALCLGYRWDASRVRAHYETSLTGKWDPGDPDGISFGGHRVMDMGKMRAAVAAWMRHPEGEDDMTPDEVREIAEKVVAKARREERAAILEEVDRRIHAGATQVRVTNPYSPDGADVSLKRFVDEMIVRTEGLRK